MGLVSIILSFIVLYMSKYSDLLTSNIFEDIKIIQLGYTLYIILTITGLIFCKPIQTKIILNYLLSFWIVVLVFDLINLDVLETIIFIITLFTSLILSKKLIFTKKIKHKYNIIYHYPNNIEEHFNCLIGKELCSNKTFYDSEREIWLQNTEKGLFPKRVPIAEMQRMIEINNWNVAKAEKTFADMCKLVLINKKVNCKGEIK